MAGRNTYRILIWILVIMVVGNLSMGLSYWYHRRSTDLAYSAESNKQEIPGEQRTRFFRDKLNLTPDQLTVFRELNREFNRSARLESDKLENLRIEMLEEMAKDKPSSTRLDSVAREIGSRHTALKKITIKYYLDMKAVCNGTQQKKLMDLFLEASKSDRDIALPERGRRQRQRQAE